jgi:hypothetical protein
MCSCLRATNCRLEAASEQELEKSARPGQNKRAGAGGAKGAKGNAVAASKSSQSDSSTVQQCTVVSSVMNVHPNLSYTVIHQYAWMEVAHLQSKDAIKNDSCAAAATLYGALGKTAKCILLCCKKSWHICLIVVFEIFRTVYAEQLLFAKHSMNDHQHRWTVSWHCCADLYKQISCRGRCISATKEWVSPAVQ